MSNKIKSKNIELGPFSVGNNSPCFIIAEAGVNHNGSIQLAKKLIDAAKDAGVDAVKFQTFKAKDLTTKTAEQAKYQTTNIGKKESQQNMLKKLEISYNDFELLKKYCDNKEIMFLSTPHSNMKDISLVSKLCPIIKVGSGDLTNIPALKIMANTGLPIILSTGMSNLDEIKDAVDAIKTINTSIVLLHCTTNYPTPLEEVNLNAMLTLKKTFNLPVGYSDHTEGIGVSLAAVAKGACIIEKHFTLDKTMIGPDHKSSLEPKELKQLVNSIRSIENKLKKGIKSETIINELNMNIVLGDGIKRPMPSEIETMKVARKSIVTAKDIKKGTPITSEMLLIKRPGTGILPKYYDKIIGMVTCRDVKEDVLLSWNDLQKDNSKTDTIQRNIQRHILYITGSRADYGLMRNTLIEIVKNKELKLSVVVTGIHNLKPFGDTAKEVKIDAKKYGFEVISTNSTYNNDNRESMSLFLGNFVAELTNVCTKVHPDIILILGDRSEMLAGAAVGTYLGIPIAHIHGGDVSSTVDDITRHGTTKMSSVHFAATKTSADRIIKMGEENTRVFVVGAPGIDNISVGLGTKEYIHKKFGIINNEKYFIMIQHSVSVELDNAEKHIIETLEALVKQKTKTIVIYPNADACGRKMIDVIERYRSYPFIKIYPSLNHKDFLTLLNYSSGLIGNSSAGIIEAASFKKPVINIGTRQLGRERTFNVIDVDYNRNQIYSAIQKILTDRIFSNNLTKCINPYGDGNAAKNIVNILSTLIIDKELLQKKLTY